MICKCDRRRMVISPKRSEGLYAANVADGPSHVEVPMSPVSIPTSNAKNCSNQQMVNHSLAIVSSESAHYASPASCWKDFQDCLHWVSLRTVNLLLSASSSYEIVIIMATQPNYSNNPKLCNASINDVQ